MPPSTLSREGDDAPTPVRTDRLGIQHRQGWRRGEVLPSYWRLRSAASQPKVGSLVDLSVNTRRAGSDEEVLKKGEDYIRRGRDGLACCSRHDRHDRLGVRLLYDRFYPRS